MRRQIGSSGRTWLPRTRATETAEVEAAEPAVSGFWLVTGTLLLTVVVGLVMWWLGGVQAVAAGVALLAAVFVALLDTFEVYDEKQRKWSTRSGWLRRWLTQRGWALQYVGPAKRVGWFVLVIGAFVAVIFSSLDGCVNLKW